MFTQEIDSLGQIVTPEQKRHRVAQRLRRRGLSRELANELAILGGVEATMGDDLSQQLESGTLVPGGNPVALEIAARQMLLHTIAQLPRILGAIHLTVREVFAKPGWHSQIQTPALTLANAHRNQRQTTQVGNPIGLPHFPETGYPLVVRATPRGHLQALGQFGYFPIGEPPTPQTCRADAFAHMQGAQHGVSYAQPPRPPHPLPVLAPP